MKKIRRPLAPSPAPDGFKWCGYCEQFRSLNDFAVRRASKDGLGLKCRECSSAYGRAHYAANPALQQVIKNKAREWGIRNRERRREIVLKSAEARRDVKRQASIEYYYRKRREDLEGSRLTNRVYAQIRRGRIRDAGNMPPKGLVKAILDIPRGKCIYCGCTDKPLTLDHLTPIVSGGKNTFDNFVACCKSCNCAKNKEDGADWIFRSYGIQGAAETLLFLRSVRKVARRFYPSEYQDYCERMKKALHGIEIKEV